MPSDGSARDTASPSSPALVGQILPSWRQHLDRLFAAVSASGAPGAPKDLLVVPHNDPDPDAIASACALCHLLAEECGVEGRIVYHGIIGRAENKALVKYLGHPLHRLADTEPAEVPGSSREITDRRVPVALVDAQPGAGNVTLPAGAEVAIVIDHHPRRRQMVPALYADIRTGIGATSTILTQYLRAAGLEPPRPVATALFYGVKTDTMGLSRRAGPSDVEAYLYLQPRVDVRALARIENAQVPASYFKSFDGALRAARVYPAPSSPDGIVIAYLGPMDYPGLAPEMADLLQRLDRSRWVVCMGTYRDRLLMSVRTRSRRRGAEQLVVAVVGDDGTAGGHGATAAGQIPLAGRDPERLAELVRLRILSELQAEPDVEGRPLI